MDTSSATQALQTNGLAAFGISMPQLALDWVPEGTTPSYSVPASTDTTSDSFKITVSGSNWAAPLTAAFLVIDPIKGQSLPVTLQGYDGTAQTQGGVLLTVLETVWLRLNWIYTQALETAPSGGTRPEFAQGLPYRQVPRYFFYPTLPTGNSVTEGIAEAQADLGVTGDLYIYDNEGLPIDPIAVMSAFSALMTKFQLLQASTGTPALGNSLSTLLATADVQIRLINPDGSPYTGTALTNLTPLTGGQVAGLNTITTAGTAVTVQAVSAGFTQDDRNRVVFGPANGRLSDTFTPPTLPGGITLQRDFYTLRVIGVTQYLLGSVPDADLSSQCQPAPDVRVHEALTLLSNGNDVMGAVGSALTSSASPALAVAQALDGALTLPMASGTQAQWPVFPANAPVVSAAALSVTLPAALTVTAAWFNTSATDFTKIDVVVTIAGFPTTTTATTSSLVGAWVRLYTRLFGLDAVQQRGDGQGRAIPSNGTVSIYLTDPLGLKNIPNPGQPASAISVPPSATLNFDMIVVLPNQVSRIYGGLSANITAGPTPVPAFTPGTNSSTASATMGGISNSGILGLGQPPSFSPPSSITGWLNALTGDGNPRDASRLPTMARRELLAAGLVGGNWTGVIGGGRLAKEAVCTLPRLGEPGGFGGRETIYSGATSSGGRIAYDIARHALRRAQSIIDRTVTLVNSNWALPAEPAVVAAGQQPSGASGTFAGAVLQNIAPYCESPELGPLLSSNPSTINDFVSGLVNTASGLPSQLGIQSDVVNALNSLMTPPPAGTTTPSDTALLIAKELIRECATAAFGRRDTQWALQSALAQARHFIYIETPGFCTIADNSDSPLPSFAVDLIGLMNKRMQAMPGLRTIVSVPKYADFATGYEGMAAYEVLDRYNILVGQPNAHPTISSQLPTNQTVGFHPIGFPGRYSRIESTVIVIDDCWALVGGSTFRRRGMGFDGSSDLVFTDTQLVQGRSPSIRDFRRALMAARLGIPADADHPSYVQLNDGQRSFSLVRQTLQSGGLGNIDLLWNGITPHVTPTTPLALDQANPDGRKFGLSQISQAAIISAFAASVSGW